MHVVHQDKGYTVLRINVPTKEHSIDRWRFLEKLPPKITTTLEDDPKTYEELNGIFVLLPFHPEYETIFVVLKK